jgi:cobalt-precorrin 5A hydrolase
MRTVVIHLSDREAAARVASMIDADLLPYHEDAFERAFAEYEAVVAIMAIGIVVRKISPLLRDKWTDPPVVVVSPDLRYAIPIMGGHHGANEIARSMGEHGIVPVITTATDALGKDSVEEVAARTGMEVVNKTSTVAVNVAFLHGEVPVYNINGPAVVVAGPGVSFLARKGEYVVGIGCNRGTHADEIVESVDHALEQSAVARDEVLTYATTVKKIDEVGLFEAVRRLEGNLLYLEDEVLNAQPVDSVSKAELIGLVGVAEPSALALSKRKELVMRRRAYGNVTVAIAR